MSSIPSTILVNVLPDTERPSRGSNRSLITHPLCIVLPDRQSPCYGLGRYQRALVGSIHGNPVAHAFWPQRVGLMRRVGGSRTKIGDGWSRQPCEFYSPLDTSACGRLIVR